MYLFWFVFASIHPQGNNICSIQSYSLEKYYISKNYFNLSNNYVLFNFRFVCSLNSCVKFTESQNNSEFYIQQWGKLLEFEYKEFWLLWIGWNNIHQLKQSMSDFVSKQYSSTRPLRSLVKYGNKLNRKQTFLFFFYQNNRYAAAERPVFSSQYCD